MFDYNYFIAELTTQIANLERLKRGLEQERDGQQPPPSRVEYDRNLLQEPPRAVQVQEEAPRCNCGLPAVFKKSAPQNPKQWAAWFCAKLPKDPKNCGYRKWID